VRIMKLIWLGCFLQDNIDSSHIFAIVVVTTYIVCRRKWLVEWMEWDGSSTPSFSVFPTVYEMRISKTLLVWERNTFYCILLTRYFLLKKNSQPRCISWINTPQKNMWRTSVERLELVVWWDLWKNF
jgi:hypothetical protein